MRARRHHIDSLSVSCANVQLRASLTFAPEPARLPISAKPLPTKSTLMQVSETVMLQLQTTLPKPRLPKPREPRILGQRLGPVTTKQSPCGRCECLLIGCIGRARRI